jgi:hypothetical protein
MRLRRTGRVNILDAHFLYPDGYAATLLGRWLDIPVSVTLRGTEPRHATQPGLRRRLRLALRGAQLVIAVSDSLRQLAIELGAAPERTRVVGNGLISAISVHFQKEKRVTGWVCHRERRSSSLSGVLSSERDFIVLLNACRTCVSDSVICIIWWSAARAQKATGPNG